MKIVHVITRLYKGGAEENTLMNCLHQAQSGHEATLMYGPDNFTPELYAPFQKDIHFQPVAYLKHPIQLINDLRGLYELVALFKKIQPDIVHTHESKAGVLGRLAAKCAGVRHIVHGVHIIPFNNVSLPQKILFVAAEHVSALITDLFVHVSAGTRQAYARARIGASKAHHVVYSGMNIDKFIQAREPEDWRSLLNVSPSSPKPKVIVMLAVLEPRKQQLGFLDGFARATKPGDNIRLILAGDGPLKDEITVRIAALNLSDRVIMAGHSPIPEQLIAMADVGVLASVREGLPRVVVQYLARKCPAVVSNIDGIEEIVKDGENGIIVRSLSAEAVAMEAVALLSDEARLSRLKAGAAATDVSRWSFASMFRECDRCYADLLNKKRRA